MKILLQLKGSAETIVRYNNSIILLTCIACVCDRDTYLTLTLQYVICVLCNVYCVKKKMRVAQESLVMNVKIHAKKLEDVSELKDGFSIIVTSIISLLLSLLLL